jgi:hypothetical protein
MNLLKLVISSAFAASSLLAGSAYELVPSLSSTSVVLSPAFVNALTSLRVSPGGIESGNLVAQGSAVTATFSIPTARVDFSNLRLQIVHNGGLSLRAGSTFVTLSDFVIENFAAGPRLTGIVKVNETVVGRIPLFTITLAGAPEVKALDSTTDTGTIGRLTIKGALSLTQEAASALNATFGVTAFARGFAIGDATVNATYSDGQ